MITETIAVEGLYIISLALSSTEKWQAARSSFRTNLRAEGVLALFAVIALIVSEILLFWVFSKYRRSEELLNKKINDLTITNEKLQQDKDKTNQDNKKLKKEITELMATNNKLLQESTQLTRSN